MTLTPGSFQTNVTTGAGGQPIPQTQTSVSGAGQGIATSVAPAGPIQMNLSPEDFGSQIKQAQDAAYQAQTQYLDPQFNQQEESLRQRLADQGIEEGSDAYSRAMLDFNNQKQQAYQSAQEGAVAAGNQLQQQLFTQQLQSGQFANSSEAQQYVQNLQDAGFINEAQAQNFNQQIQAGTFANQAAQQVFGPRRFLQPGGARRRRHDQPGGSARAGPCPSGTTGAADGAAGDHRRRHRGLQRRARQHGRGGAMGQSGADLADLDPDDGRHADDGAADPIWPADPGGDRGERRRLQHGPTEPLKPAGTD